MSYSSTRVILSIALGIALTLPVSADEAAATSVEESSPHAVAVSLGAFGADGFDDSEFAYQASWFYRKRPCLPKTWKKGCDFKLTFIKVKEPIVDIWRPERADQLATILEFGPAWIFTAEIEVGVELGTQWEARFFGGPGFRHDEAAITEVPGLGTFRTASLNSPVVTYGVALVYGTKVSLRLEARGVTSFLGTLDAVGPDNTATAFEGGTTTSLSGSVGTSYRF